MGKGIEPSISRIHELNEPSSSYQGQYLHCLTSVNFNLKELVKIKDELLNAKWVKSR